MRSSSEDEGGLVGLFAVTRKATSVPLVIEAASVVAENGEWVFRTVDGDSLVRLAAENVRRVETVRPQVPPPPRTFLRRVLSW